MMQPPFTECETMVQAAAVRQFGADGRVRLVRRWVHTPGPDDHAHVYGYFIAKDMSTDQQVTGYAEDAIGAAPDPYRNEMLYGTPEEALADAINRGGQAYEGVVVG